MILTGTMPIDCLPQAEGHGPSSQPSLLGEPGLASREATAATPPHVPLVPPPQASWGAEEQSGNQLNQTNYSQTVV